MSRTDTRAWLAEFQRDFSAALRTGLDSRSGALQAQPARYAPALISRVDTAANSSARARLAVYNRQYWFRLLGAMQATWPLTARLLGLFRFNVLALRFLERTPPAHYDLHVATLGFDAYLAESPLRDAIELGPELAPLPKQALLEASAIDAAFARVFYAPEQPRLVLAPCSSQELLARKLVSSPAYARITEHWPLMRLRLSLLDERGEHPVELPQREELGAPQHWVLHRTATGLRQVCVSALHARLLMLLETHCIAEALARLEAEVTAEERDSLPQWTQRWLGLGIQHGFWSALA